MHELSLCLNLLKQVLNTAQQHQASAIQTIDVQLGPLGGISAEQLGVAFAQASAGTLAAGAELRIESLPLTIRCRSCGASNTVVGQQLDCPACLSTDTDPLPGDTLVITNVELHL